MEDSAIARSKWRIVLYSKVKMEDSAIARSKWRIVL